MPIECKLLLVLRRNQCYNKRGTCRKTAEWRPIMDTKDIRNTTDRTEAAKAEQPAHEAAPEVVLQYRGYEVNMETMTERVKAHYYAKGYKKGTIRDLQIYVKPEDFTAYYVINDGVVGKVNLFYD